jgi:hypothetical protein
LAQPSDSFAGSFSSEGGFITLGRRVPRRRLAQTDRDRRVIGLHPPFFHDG